MAYSRITATHDGREALKYAEGNGKGHNDNEKRNEVISSVNMVDKIPYADQMQKFWLKARPNHKIQVRRIIQSFSINELDPNKPEDREKANVIGREFVKKYFPSRQAVIFTQIDGKSGLIHNHIIISDVHMETYKGFTKKEYHYETIESYTNEIASEFITLDSGNKSADKSTQTERVKRKQGKYVWKDDLKERIRKAMLMTSSEDDYIKNLESCGVSAIKKENAKRGEHFTYELIDRSKAPEGQNFGLSNGKSRSYKLGFSYGIDALREYLSHQPKPKAQSKQEITQDKSSQKSDTKTSEASEFAEYLKKIGESWISYEDGKANYDFDKFEALELQFKKYKETGDLDIDEEIESILQEKEPIENIVPIIFEDYEEETKDNSKEKFKDLKKRNEKIQQALRNEEEIIKRNKRRLEDSNKLLGRLNMIQESNDYSLGD